jgi:hypothetical protein
MARSARKPAGVLAGVVVSAATVAAGVAMAHNKEFSNSVTLAEARQYAPNLDSYGGRVISGHPRCKRRREVQIWRADVTPEVRVLTTRTGPYGRYRRKGPDLPNGAKVYALIETRVLLSNGAHDHTCPVDRSPVRTMPHP